MLNIVDTLHHWCREARPFALATVVDVTGSAPLPAGTSVAVDEDGNAVGSISGGCVEGAVYELCRQVLHDQAAPQRARFGYSDDDAFAAGLTCGGELDVLVQRIDPATQPHLCTALAEVVQGRPAAVAQVVDAPNDLTGRMLCVGAGGGTQGILGGDAAERQVRAQAEALLQAGRTARVDVGGDAATCPERLSVLVHVHASRPRMLIFGAIDFAAALSQAGRFLGYRVTVCDARPVFATPARFPHADDVVVDWPHRYLRRTQVDARTAVCVLTHDVKFDIPLLRLALELPVGYIGAMGSRRTHDRRLDLLREAGVPAEQLARLRSPIGLDLGARTPEETAVSIAAEIIAHSNDRTGLPLSTRIGPIHPQLPQGRLVGAGDGIAQNPRSEGSTPLRGAAIHAPAT
ncbi:xanthine dehydrogenase accessory factor [Streptomyces sp. V4I23]|uniref:XdhC family protein n=1 Tax=Streptomyces sp. V4I23 TaxID=3042282 RepID=UPI00277E1D41|nr:XdhC/CoxI family protein [Streptomyces sp. V4I23]MDQ1006782.1 xanthine dehydrogenase accessory factor [Streptomyces sp. V4I23]